MQHDRLMWVMIMIIQQQPNAAPVAHLGRHVDGMLTKLQTKQTNTSETTRSYNNGNGEGLTSENG